MKFGKNLLRDRVPVWANSYLDYHGLREWIRLCHVSCDSTSNLTGLLYSFNREINNVQVFYDNVYSTIWNEVPNLSMGSQFLDRKDWELADEPELQFHLEALVQCFVSLTRLRSFGVLNSRGFERLWEKLDHLKAHPSAAVLDKLKMKLSTAHFSCQTELLYDIERVRVSVAAIAQILSCKSFMSQRSLVLHHFAQRSSLALGSVNHLHLALRDDNFLALEKVPQDLGDSVGVERWLSQELLSVLVQLSIIYGSKACLKKLLKLLHSLHGDEEFAKVYLPSVVNKIIVRIGHQKTFLESLSRISSCNLERISPILDDKMLSLLVDILANFRAHVQTPLFTQHTLYKRVTFHYVAEYGLPDVCQLLSHHMQDAKAHCGFLVPELILLQDHFGNSPLRLAISHGFEEVSRHLLGVLSCNGGLDSHTWKSVSGSLLTDAVTGINASPEFLKCLFAAKSNVNHQGFAGETGLYIAARSGRADLVECLLVLGASTVIAERTKGWTPLIIASVEGHVNIVEILLQAGASSGYKDHRGWTALDHAAFRGHITLSRKLRQLGSINTHDYPPSDLESPSRTVRKIPSVTSVTSESVILVNLGSLDSKKTLDPTDLSLCGLKNESTAESEAHLSIQISLIGGQGPVYTVALPLLEDMTNKPWTFYTNDLSNARLLFKVHRENVTADKLKMHEHIGSAVALLENLKQGLGSTRESLIRDYTIPILSTGSLENIGAITFSFLVVKPFPQPNFSLPARATLWKDSGCTKVVGHRGLGQNISNPKNLSIGENTTQSFLTAMDLGADWVELDVQLTKDHIPVIYHDFLVSETGMDTWMHNVTFEQFMHLSNSQSTPERTFSTEPSSSPRKCRSYSLDPSNECRPIHLTEQLKRTFEFKQKGFKGNVRGEVIQQSFLTLHDLLSQTPDSVALNIEIKYPTLFEAAHDWKSDIFAIEVNLFVDTILLSVLSHPSCRRRPIMFSSFSPEVCILMSLKQNQFPMLFCSESGNWPTGDVRASSLQEAIHFATSWGLDGIVMASEPFVFAPLLVGVAKERGLVTASYGALNDDPECAKVQAAAGIDQLIVDAVRLISETLGSVSH